MDNELQVTRTVFRVGDFLSWQRHGSLDLRPPFQRGNVWSRKAKSYLLDTIIRGYPIPLIILQDQTDPATLEPIRRVVDGQQRLRTVLGFVDPSCLEDSDETDTFTISRAHNRDLAGATFKGLNNDLRQRILNFQFSVDILPVETPAKVLLEIFARLNRTGTRLNDQEIRNAEWSGEFKQLVYGLSYEQLERWLDWRVFSQQQIAQMRDAELVSELVMFMLEGLSGKSQTAITARYREYDDDFPYATDVARRFDQILSKLDEIYNDEFNELYREEFAETPFNTQGWFYILYGFVYELMYDATIPQSTRLKPRSVSGHRLRKHLVTKAFLLRSGDIQPELAKSLRGAATDRGSRQARYDFLVDGF